jgi:hypothetical protein
VQSLQYPVQMIPTVAEAEADARHRALSMLCQARIRYGMWTTHRQSLGNDRDSGL